MAENLVGAAADVVTEMTCGICLEEPNNDPLNLPCGHSFCAGCLDKWRSRYGVEEEMRRQCPICRARIPPSKEMVATLQGYRAQKQRMEDDNDTSSQQYRDICRLAVNAAGRIGAGWDGVTILEDSNARASVLMPDYIGKAIVRGDIKSVLKWINSNQSEDRANAKSSAEKLSMPVLTIASMYGHLTLTTLLLQLGADVDIRDSEGVTPIRFMISCPAFTVGAADKVVKLLLSWGASFFPGKGFSKEWWVDEVRSKGAHQLADLVESEIGGRRCEIINLTSQPELNGKTCVADEYLPDKNLYKVTLETKCKEMLFLSPDNLKRRDRTPQDCGYYIEFKNGRTIRHDFESSEDCQTSVTAMNRDETKPAVTDEAEARAEQAAAELLAELGLDNSPDNVPKRDGQVKKSKKKKGGKKKKK